MASNAAARISDDELWGVLGWRPTKEQEADKSWPAWLAQTKAWICSATIDRFGQPRDQQEYLCRLLSALESVHTTEGYTRGVKEDVLRPAFVSGLVLSGAKATIDVRFDDLIAIATHRGQVICEECDEWAPGMRSGSGRRTYYRLSLAGQRLADDSAPVVEPVLENWFIVNQGIETSVVALVKGLSSQECETLIDALDTYFQGNPSTAFRFSLKARAETSLTAKELVCYRVALNEMESSPWSLDQTVHTFANEIRALRKEAEQRVMKNELEFWTRVASGQEGAPAAGKAEAADTEEPSAEEPAAESEALPQSPEAVAESDALEACQTPADDPNGITALAVSTPALEPKSDAWATAEQVANLESKEVRTLANYRSQGASRPDGTFGRDRDGRIWRKATSKARTVYYLRESLPSKAEGDNDY